MRKFNTLKNIPTPTVREFLRKCYYREHINFLKKQYEAGKITKGEYFIEIL